MLCRIELLTCVALMSIRAHVLVLSFYPDVYGSRHAIQAFCGLPFHHKICVAHTNRTCILRFSAGCFDRLSQSHMLSLLLGRDVTPSLFRRSDQPHRARRRTEPKPFHDSLGPGCLTGLEPASVSVHSRVLCLLSYKHHDNNTWSDGVMSPFPM